MPKRQPEESPDDVAFKSLPKNGLPANIDAERLIIGSVVLDDSRYADFAPLIKTEAFALDKHRILWARIVEIKEAGGRLDSITLANELMRFNELASVDGLSYVMSLDEGLPQIPNLDGYVKILIEKWRLRKAIFVAKQTMDRAMSEEFTADEISQDAQAKLSEQVGGFGSSQIEFVRDYIANYPGGINTMLDPSKWDQGIPTGFSELDEWTDGLHKGEIFVIAARPGGGKSAAGSNMAKTIARSGKSVAVFTMELSKKMFVDRMICEEAFISYLRYRRGLLDEGERRRLREATNAIAALPLAVDDTMGLRVADMRVKLAQLEKESPVDVVLADYAQLIRAAKGKRFNSENDKFADICEDLKLLFKSSGKSLILLSQLNRDSEKAGNDKPKLSQCRGAGAFEEVAYVGACIYREWTKKKERADLRDYAELLVDKNRSGRTGIIKLKFIDWAMRFENWPTEVPTPEGT